MNGNEKWRSVSSRTLPVLNGGECRGAKQSHNERKVDRATADYIVTGRAWAMGGVR
jgi:heptaprenylglyceryl phosphate synthase